MVEPTWAPAPASRVLAALLLVAVAAGLAALAWRLDWGLGALCVLPALLLALIAADLLRNRRLCWRDGTLYVCTVACGLRLREGSLAAADIAALAALPMLGFRLVLAVPQAGKPLVLGAWLSADQCTALLAWMDAHAADPAGWPRSSLDAHPNDR